MDTYNLASAVVEYPQEWPLDHPVLRALRRASGKFLITPTETVELRLYGSFDTRASEPSGDVLSGDAFEDECAMRAMQALITSGRVPRERASDATRALVTAAYDVAAAMRELREWKRRQA